MAWPERLQRASARRAALEPAFVDLARYDVSEIYPQIPDTTDASPLGVLGAVDLIDNSPTVRIEHRGHAGDNQLATTA